MPATRRRQHTRTSAHRANTGVRRKFQEKVPAHNLPGRGRRRRAANSSPGTDTSNFLNPKFGRLDVFVISPGSMFDSPNVDPKETIKQMYKCLLHIPGFKDNKNWKKLPSLAELADYFTGELEGLLGEEYKIEYDERGKLRVEVYRELDELRDTFAVPLEWVAGISNPLLKQVNEDLFSLILCTIGKIAHAWHLDVILNNYNSFFIDEFEMHVMDADEDEKADLLRDVLKYRKKGEAYLFKQRIIASNALFDKEALFKEVRGYRPRTPLQKKLKAWLLLAEPALQESCSIGMYRFPDREEYPDGDPVNPDDMFAFTWSFCDKVHECADDYLNQQAGQVGVVGPTIMTTYYPDKAPMISKKEEPIIALSKFMDAGRNIYFDDFHTIYKSIADKKGHEHTLINILT